MQIKELTIQELDKRYEYFMHEYSVIYRSGDVQLLASRNGGFIVRRHDDDRYHGTSKTTALRAFNDAIGAYQDVDERVKTVIRESLNIEKDAIIMSTYKIDLIITLFGGERNFERNEIMEHTEDEFNIKIPDSVFERLETVQDIINLVKGHENERKENVV